MNNENILFKITIIFFLSSVFIGCFNQNTRDFPIIKIKPYDPIKAGAEIIESYDLSDIYINDYYTYRFTEYNDKFYIIHNSRIYVYDKKVIIKEKEIIIDIKDVLTDKFNFDYKIGNTKISIYNNKILFSSGITLDEEKRILRFFDMDLSGDNLRALDISSDLNFNNPPSITYGINQGYNVVKDAIWIKINNAEIYEYKFDGTTYNKVNYLYIQDFGHDIYHFNENIFWNQGAFNEVESTIHKRNIADPNTVISTIDIAYLGTCASPHDLIVDGEFLWIIIWKDDKLQLLKLRPL